MTSNNFYFLEPEWPKLFELINSAEQYLYLEPNITIFKLRQFAENLTKILLANNKETNKLDVFNQAERIKVLLMHEVIPLNISSILEEIRQKGNLAVHDNLNSLDDALSLLIKSYNLSIWFMKCYTQRKEYELPDYDVPDKQYVPNPNIDRPFDEAHKTIIDFEQKGTFKDNITKDDRELLARMIGYSHIMGKFSDKYPPYYWSNGDKEEKKKYIDTFFKGYTYPYQTIVDSLLLISLLCSSRYCNFNNVEQLIKSEEFNNYIKLPIKDLYNTIFLKLVDFYRFGNCYPHHFDDKSDENTAKLVRMLSKRIYKKVVWEQYL